MMEMEVSALGKGTLGRAYVLAAAPSLAVFSKRSPWRGNSLRMYSTLCPWMNVGVGLSIFRHGELRKLKVVSVILCLYGSFQYNII